MRSAAFCGKILLQVIKTTQEQLCSASFLLTWIRSSNTLSYTSTKNTSENSCDWHVGSISRKYKRSPFYYVRFGLNIRNTDKVNLLTLLRMGLCGAAHEWRGQKGPTS